MRHYPLHKELSQYKSIRPPLTTAALPLVNAVLWLIKPRRKRVCNVSVQKLAIPRADGTKLNALLYSPETNQASLPCLVLYHGGGFAMSAAPLHYRLAAHYAAQTPCRVLFVDYALAPRHRFPAAFEDACLALSWLRENAVALNIDSGRIAVGGDSAGGDLAAAVALKSRDNGDAPLCLQLLIYPVLDARMQTRSMREFSDTPMWNAVLSRKMWQWYLPESYICSAYASPAQASSLGGLPQAYIECAEFDCLRDEALEYADSLKSAGVSVSCTLVGGGMHGYDTAYSSKLVQGLTAARVKALREAFRTR